MVEMMLGLVQDNIFSSGMMCVVVYVCHGIEVIDIFCNAAEGYIRSGREGK
jgi:hypothetical protein